jgi:small-conductance mechanosensitive channel
LEIGRTAIEAGSARDPSELTARRRQLSHRQHIVALLNQRIERPGRMRTTWQRRYAIVSDIRYRIDELFTENGIVIAFPQIDVHLDGSRSSS